MQLNEFSAHENFLDVVDDVCFERRSVEDLAAKLLRISDKSNRELPFLEHISNFKVGFIIAKASDFGSFSFALFFKPLEPPVRFICLLPLHFNNVLFGHVLMYLSNFCNFDIVFSSLVCSGIYLVFKPVLE